MVELNPKSKQGDLVKALEPVSDHLTKRFKAARDALQAAKASGDEVGAKAAQTTCSRAS